jgi:hypothetical protein
MTAVTDAKTVIETLIGRTLTNDQLGRIGARFKEADEDEQFEIQMPGHLGVFADPDNPTNEEMAQLFLDTVLVFSKRTVRGMAQEAEETQVNIDLKPENISQRIKDAGDAAEADIT